MAIYFSRSQCVFVRENILVAISPWFERALTPEWCEGQDDVVRFGDATPDTVKVFIYWLIHNQIPDVDNCASVSALEYQKLMVRAWMFAEEKGVPAMQNLVMRALMESLRTVGDGAVSTEVLRLALPITGRGSLLRKALVHEAMLVEAETGLQVLNGVNLVWVDGWYHDAKIAEKEFEKRKGRRARVEKYFVKE